MNSPVPKRPLHLIRGQVADQGEAEREQGYGKRPDGQTQ